LNFIHLEREEDTMKYLRALLVVFILLVSLLTAGPVLADPGDTTRLSVSSSGVEGNDSSHTPSVSANGCLVVFSSFADNLVIGDTNHAEDIFLYNCKTGMVRRLSAFIGRFIIQGNNGSREPSISADGRYVAFSSYASNLVRGDTNDTADILVYELRTGTIRRVSVDSTGVQGNGRSMRPSISANGDYVAFESEASNLVAGDTNGEQDIFVHDRTTGETTRVSVNSSGIQGNDSSGFPSISAQGHSVAFYSTASNLVPGDTNGVMDVFVHDHMSGVTIRASVDSTGNQGNNVSVIASISGDARYVAFESAATNLVADDANGASTDIFVYDRKLKTTTLVSVDSSGAQGNSVSFFPSISSNGNYVAFWSASTNLVDGDTNGKFDVFVHDRTTGETTRVSVDSNGKQGDDDSYYPAIASDGSHVTFHSLATNLVEGDTNGVLDIFVRELDNTPLP
jgi:Tol biopolymer transport system component